MPHLLLIPLCVGAALLVWGFNALALRSWRRSAGQHWTERARALYPALVSRKINQLAIPALLVAIVRIRFPELPWTEIALVAYAGALLGSFPMDREIHQDLRFGVWAHLTFAAAFVQGLRWGAWGAAIILMPREVTVTSLLIPFGWVALVIALELGLALTLLRWVKLLIPASPHLRSLVDQANRHLNVKVKSVWELKTLVANALAITTTQELLFTTPLLKQLSDDEVVAVAAHELGHLAESPSVKIVRVVGALTLLPLIFINPVAPMLDPQGIFALLGLCWAIYYAIRKMRRAMEKRADRMAVEQINDPTIYARALEKLYRVNQIPAVLASKQAGVHPNLYDRMTAAQVTPDYPRPQPPPRQHWTSAVTVFMATLLLLFAFVGW